MTTALGPAGTTTELVLERLREAILARELAPRQRIRQELLAEQLGTSIAPVREALRVLEQEGQVTYVSRRGYFVTALSIADLEEIYEMRQLLEERAVRRTLPGLDEDGLDRLARAAAECVHAAEVGDIVAELEANRRFHFGLFENADHPHTLRIIRMLWDSTEAYRAVYYNSMQERREAASAHERIIAAVRTGKVERVIAELDAHRARALEVLRPILSS